MKQLQKANNKLLKKIYRKKPPEEIIFDLDSTISKTYGEQYGSAYNKYYGHDGYNPL